MIVWLRPPGSLLTQSGHERAAFAAMHVPWAWGHRNETARCPGQDNLRIKRNQFRGVFAHFRVAPVGTPLMACQQLVAHLTRIHLSRPLVSVRECANRFIAEEPCYLRDRKVGVTQIMRGEIGAELTENFTEAQAFRSQPPRQRSAAHPKRLRDRAELRFTMR